MRKDKRNGVLVRLEKETIELLNWLPEYRQGNKGKTLTKLLTKAIDTPENRLAAQKAVNAHLQQQLRFKDAQLELERKKNKPAA